MIRIYICGYNYFYTTYLFVITYANKLLSQLSRGFLGTKILGFLPNKKIPMAIFAFFLML